MEQQIPMKIEVSWQQLTPQQRSEPRGLLTVMESSFIGLQIMKRFLNPILDHQPCWRPSQRVSRTGNVKNGVPGSHDRRITDT